MIGPVEFCCSTAISCSTNNLRAAIGYCEDALEDLTNDRIPPILPFTSLLVANKQSFFSMFPLDFVVKGSIAVRDT